jgi:hypothetical protein
LQEIKVGTCRYFYHKINLFIPLCRTVGEMISELLWQEYSTTRTRTTTATTKTKTTTTTTTTTATTTTTTTTPHEFRTLKRKEQEPASKTTKQCKL